MKRTELRRKTPLKRWRRPKKDQVTQDLVAYLAKRDGWCIVPTVETAAGLIAAGPCQGRSTVEHVRDEAAMGAPRATSDPAHTVAVCLGHIEWTKTARAKKLERDYLSVKEGVKREGLSAEAVPTGERRDEVGLSDSGEGEGGR